MAKAKPTKAYALVNHWGDICGEEPLAFYEKHRGGSGPVVLAIGIEKKTGDEVHRVFSSIETATAWRRAFDPEKEWGFVFTPYVVDEPDFGNKEPS